MSVTRFAQSQFDIKNIEALVKSLEQEILDGEYAERLAHNADWAALERAYRESLKSRLLDYDDLKSRLISLPLSGEEAIQLRERVMLLERDRVNAEDFLGYPTRMKEQLKELRRELETHRMTLRKLRGEDHG